MGASDIHVGAGSLVLNPDSSPITVDSTTDGCTVSFSAELEDIMIDQVLCAVDHFIPGEECTMEVMINEGTADKLKLALGATDQTVSTQVADADNKGYSQINFGGNYILTDYVAEYKAKRRNAANLYIIIRLHKVHISPNLEAVYSKDGVTQYKLTLKACADTSQEVGQQVGYYRQETADVTGTTATLAVSSTDPADGAVDMAIDEAIDIVFNRNVHPESVNSGNFILMDDTPAEVASTVAFTGDAGTNVTVTPSANLSNSSTYYLVISENVMALDDKTKMSADVIIDVTTVGA